MCAYSYHNFMFPFQWRIKGFDGKTFSEQISLKNIQYALGANWERTIQPAAERELDDLYNERNYFYDFVHDALYDNGEDNSLVRHFERVETKHGDVTYMIESEGKKYELRTYAINLNLYSTGVGMLSFYLYNEKYPAPEDVLRINQVGRRVFPPFIASVNSPRRMIANSIELIGLHGRETGYREDFSRYTNKTPSNQVAAFIEDMIHEVAANVTLKPVIDDRMFVQCWYKNDEWAGQFCDAVYGDFLNNPQWYEFVFVDDLNGMSCQNKNMQQEIIKNATYERWQKWYSLYGVSRYSMVYLTNNNCPPFLLNNFETMYARMAELVLVQKASVLRFSAEVTNLSNMDVKSDFGRKVSSLYKEYIRFVNQIHFREVSAQDQGIELYQKLYDVMKLKNHVEKLDDEIEELYNYVSLREDRKTNSTMSLLTRIATIAVPMTVIAGIFGMNNKILGQDKYFLCPINNLWVQLTFVLVITVIVIFVINIIEKRRLK